MATTPYTITVHLIEAQDVRMRSRALANPYVEVVVAGERRRTFVTEEASSCLWDVTFTFDNVHLTPAQYRRDNILIRLRSANLWAADDVLGEYAFNISSVHGQTEARYQVYNTWIAVPDGRNPAVTAGNIRLTVTVLAPGDALKSTVALPAADRAGGSDGGGGTGLALGPLTPPTIDKRAASINLRLFRGEGLPFMDGGAVISPYIVLRHGCDSVQSTTLHHTSTPVWNEDLLLPCMRNGHVDDVMLELWHRRTWGGDVLVASARFSLIALSLADLGLHWVNLVGPLTDARYLSAAGAAPGVTGALVTAIHTLLPPLAAGSGGGLPCPAIHLGRLLIAVRIWPGITTRACRLIREVPAEPDAGATLVTLRLLEVRGWDVGGMGQVRAVVSYGPSYACTPWMEAPAGIATFDFRPHPPLHCRSMPCLVPTSPAYLQHQAWDVFINLFTFTPLAGVRHVGIVRIPATAVTRSYWKRATARLPVVARWYPVAPATQPASTMDGTASDDRGRDCVTAMTALVQVAISQQRPSATTAFFRGVTGAVNSEAYAASPFLRKPGGGGAGTDDTALGDGTAALRKPAWSHAVDGAGGGDSDSEGDDADSLAGDGGGGGEVGMGVTAAEVREHLEAEAVAAARDEGIVLVTGATDGAGDGEVGGDDPAPGSRGGASIAPSASRRHVTFTAVAGLDDAPQDGSAAAKDSEEAAVQGRVWVSEVRMMTAPLPYPITGEAAAATRRAISRWGREAEPVDGSQARIGAATVSTGLLEGATTAAGGGGEEGDGRTVRSGPRFMRRAAEGLLDPEIIIERKLFCCIYQARGLPVPPGVFLSHQSPSPWPATTSSSPAPVGSGDGGEIKGEGSGAWLTRVAGWLGGGSEPPPPTAAGMAGLTVAVTTALTARHTTPPCTVVGPCALWYHAVMLPLTMRLPPRKRDASQGRVTVTLDMGAAGGSVVGEGEGASMLGNGDEGVVEEGEKEVDPHLPTQEELDYEYAWQDPRARALLSDDAVPPGLSLTIQLQGQPVAYVPESQIGITSRPTWLPLVSASDPGLAGGEVLVWLTYKDDVLHQWVDSTDPDDIDKAVRDWRDEDEAGMATSASPMSWPCRAMLDQYWQCAKEYGVPKDVAVSLARHAQPWLPVCRPVDGRLFVQGVRDLDLPLATPPTALVDLPTDAASAAWRVEIHIPDAGDATLAAGHWWRHVQRGCATVAPNPSPAAPAADAARAEGGRPPARSDAGENEGGVDLPPSADLSFARRAGWGQHARYAPWQLVDPPPGQRLEVEAATLADERWNSDSVFRPGTPQPYRRTPATHVQPSAAVMVLEVAGCPVRASEGLPRTTTMRLSLTNPQLIASTQARYPIWLPLLPQYAPDATILVWRRSAADLPNDTMAETWAGLHKRGWRGMPRRGGMAGLNAGGRGGGDMASFAASTTATIPWTLVGAAVVPLQPLLAAMPLYRPLAQLATEIVAAATVAGHGGRGSVDGGGSRPRAGTGGSGGRTATRRRSGGSVASNGTAVADRYYSNLVGGVGGLNGGSGGAGGPRYWYSPVQLEVVSENDAPAVLAFRGQPVWADMEPVDGAQLMRKMMAEDGGLGVASFAPGGQLAAGAGGAGPATTMEAAAARWMGAMDLVALLGAGAAGGGKAGGVGASIHGSGGGDGVSVWSGVGSGVAGGGRAISSVLSGVSGAALAVNRVGTASDHAAVAKLGHRVCEVGMPPSDAVMLLEERRLLRTALVEYHIKGLREDIALQRRKQRKEAEDERQERMRRELMGAELVEEGEGGLEPMPTAAMDHEAVEVRPALSVSDDPDAGPAATDGKRRDGDAGGRDGEVDGKGVGLEDVDAELARLKRFLLAALKEADAYEPGLVDEMEAAQDDLVAAAQEREAMVKGVAAGGSRFVAASNHLLLDFCVASPRVRHYGLMNAQRERAAWPTSSAQVPGLGVVGGQRARWPTTRMKQRLEATYSVSAPMATTTTVKHAVISAPKSLAAGRLVMEAADTTVYSAYTVPLEALPWMQSPLTPIPLAMPRVPSVGDVVGDLLTGRTLLWLDHNASLTLLQFTPQRDGSLTLQPASSQFTWVYAGFLLASLTLLPAETAFDSLLPGPDGSTSHHVFAALDRCNLLRYHVYGTGYGASGAWCDSAAPPPMGEGGGGGDDEGDDLVTLVSADGDGGRGGPGDGVESRMSTAMAGDAPAGDRVCPPWLVLGMGGGEWGNMAHPSPRPVLLSATSAFSHVRARVVVYRGYDLYGPGGGYVRTYLRVRVEGNGVEEGDAPGLTLTAGMDTPASGAIRLTNRLQPDGSTGDDGGSGGAGGGAVDAAATMLTAHPVYAREFVVDACIPGRCSLVVEVCYDSNLPGAPAAVLGHTRINLERRWNNGVWRHLARAPPVETRCVYPPPAPAAAGYASSSTGVLTVSSGARAPPDVDDNEDRVVVEEEGEEEGGAPLITPGAAAAGTQRAGRVCRGRLKLWVALASPGATLPSPPLDTEGGSGAVGAPWELRVVVWWLQQREKGSRVPIYATGEMCRVGDGEEKARGLQPGATGMSPGGVTSLSTTPGSAASSASQSTGAASWWAALFGGGAGQQPSLEDQMAMGAAYIATAYRTPHHHGRRGTGPDKQNLEFNWRMKFRVRVDGASLALPPRLRLRAWRPLPWPYSDHLLSEAVLDLEPMMRQAAQTSSRQDCAMQTVSMKPVGQYGTRGWARIQVALVPESGYQARPVGVGRSLPNQDPFIPEPDIPPAETWWERALRWMSTTGLCLILLAAVIIIAVLATRRVE